MTKNRCDDCDSIGFACKDCSVCTCCTDEYYMVTDEIWSAANKQRTNGMLCIGCLEARLGRTLTGEDFPDYPINRGFFMMSARLAQRISTSNGQTASAIV